MNILELRDLVIATLEPVFGLPKSVVTNGHHDHAFIYWDRDRTDEHGRRDYRSITVLVNGAYSSTPYVMVQPYNCPFGDHSRKFNHMETLTAGLVAETSQWATWLSPLQPRQLELVAA